MSNLIEFIPAHVREYLETQDSPVRQGLEFISNLEDEDTFISADKQLESAEKTARILRGFLYARYRDLSDGRTFTAFLAKRGIPRATAYDYINEAQTYARLPNAQACATVAQIGQVKTRLLSQLPNEQLALFLSGDPVLGITLDEASTMTKDEFKAVISEHLHTTNTELAKANQELGRLSAKLEVTQHELADTREQLNRKFSELPFPPWVIAVREESTIHGDTALRAIEGLSLALEQVKKHTHNSLKGDELAEYRAAASLVYHQLVGVFAGVKTLLEDAQSFIPDSVIQHFDMGLPLTEGELRVRMEHRERLFQNETAQENHRAKNRAAKTQGRGRPSASPEVYPE